MASRQPSPFRHLRPRCPRELGTGGVFCDLHLVCSGRVGRSESMQCPIAMPNIARVWPLEGSSITPSEAASHPIVSQSLYLLLRRPFFSCDVLPVPNAKTRCIIWILGVLSPRGTRIVSAAIGDLALYLSEWWMILDTTRSGGVASFTDMEI